MDETMKPCRQALLFQTLINILKNVQGEPPSGLAMSGYEKGVANIVA